MTVFDRASLESRALENAGFQFFAWHGVSLRLPGEWNLRRFEGGASRGVLIFADLRAVRMEVRWRRARWGWGGAAGNAPLERVLRTLSGHRRVGENAAWFSRGGRDGLLLADARRLYELFFPAATEGGQAAAVAEHFLAATPANAAGAEWRWSVYGAEGAVPAWARLKKASLLPGETRLAFGGWLPGGGVTLGAYSLAAQRLADVPPGPAGAAGGEALRAWATRHHPVVRRFPGGRWEEGLAGELSYVVLSRGRWRRGMRLTLRHDPGSNRIHWTHRADRAIT